MDDLGSPPALYPTHSAIMADAATERSAKRRRISDMEDNQTRSHITRNRLDLDSSTLSTTLFTEAVDAEATSAISIDSSTKHASQAVAPFLTSHIPYVHSPFGEVKKGSMPSDPQRDPNSKFCYRHRLDLKCRRQANEPSMDQLQQDLESLPPNDQQGIAHVWSLFSAAPAKQRQLMLQGMLTQCCFPQLSFLAARTRELLKIDFLVALPTEIALKVLCFLDTTSLTKAAQVSKRWRQLADDDVVWHRMCEQHIDRKCTRCGWGLPLLERKRLMDSKKHIEKRAVSLALRQATVEVPNPAPEIELADDSAASQLPSSQVRPWKDVYRDRFRVGCNWKHGRFSTKTFRHNSSMGVMALQFDDKILVSGSYDGTVKVWDVVSGELMRTLRGHRSGIRCLNFDDKILVTGSLDETLRIWNWRTGECIRTLTGHEGGVISCDMSGGIIVSGSADNTVRIWNFVEKTTSVLRGHTDWVNCVRLDMASRTLFSASDDLTVRLWDLDTRQTIRTFEGHVGQVQQVVPLPRGFEFDEEPCDDEHSDAYISHTGTPAPEDPDDDVASPANSREALPLFEPTAERAGPPHYMLTGALDSMIRLWDVRSGKCLRTFFGHVEGVWALAADTLRIISGAQDRTVKIWDAKTGKCERTFTGHAGPVTCIGLGDSSMCTGSEDGEVRLYSFAAS